MQHYQNAVLHVGYDKSGSTALQSTATALQMQLQELGIYYPPPIAGDCHNLMASAFHCDPVSASSTQASGRPYLPAEVIVQQDRQYLKEYEKLIVSGSGTLFMSFEGFIWLSAGEHARLREWILKFAPVLKVLVYVRDPVSYAESAVSQRVRTGRSIKTAFHRHDINLPKLIEVYGRDNVIVRNSSRKALVGGDIRHDCLSVLGLDFVQISQLLVRTDQYGHLSNHSLSMHGIGIGEGICNLLRETDFLNTAGSQQRFLSAFDQTLRAIPGPRYSLSRSEVNALHHQSEVRSACKYLYEQFGIDFRFRPTRLLSLRSWKQNRQRALFDRLREQGVYASFAKVLLEQATQRRDGSIPLKLN